MMFIHQTGFTFIHMYRGGGGIKTVAEGGGGPGAGWRGLRQLLSGPETARWNLWKCNHLLGLTTLSYTVEAV